MYVRGISLEHIRRFGRWTSDTFRGYLRRGTQIFRFVGIAMIQAAGFLDQLQITLPCVTHVSLDAASGDADECFRVGGNGGIQENA